LDRPDSEPDSRWARRLALSDYAERIAGVGCWEWTLESDEVLWSPNLFRIFGLEPNSVAPTPPFVVSRVHPDDRGRIEELLRTLRTVGPTDRGVEYRIVHDDGTIRTLRVTVAVASEGVASDPQRLVGLIQDVTLARRQDRQRAAHVAVTQALDEWTSLESGAKGLLAGLAHALELPFAAFWVPDGSSLAAPVIWHLPSNALESVAEATRAWRPGLGSATVGRAFVGRRPIIVADATAGSPPARTAAVRDAALSGAMLVPAVDGDESLAVCEFLLFDTPEPTERLIRVLKGIGSEIGHFLSHRRGEMTRPVLTPRELAVLQLAAQARSAAWIAEELHVSPATVKRHFERAYAALGVSDRAAAVGEAMRRGLIT
jgi:PAS domain S-box-containing protein